jgi:hypothetical protein
LITLECAVINTSRRMTCWTIRPILTKRTIVHRKILCISTDQVFYFRCCRGRWLALTCFSTREGQR